MKKAFIVMMILFLFVGCGTSKTLHLKQPFYDTLSKDECTFLENIILQNKKVQTNENGIVGLDYDEDKFDAIVGKCTKMSSNDKSLLIKIVQLNTDIADFNLNTEPSDANYSEMLSEFENKYSENINSIIDKYFTK